MLRLTNNRHEVYKLSGNTKGLNFLFVFCKESYEVDIQNSKGLSRRFELLWVEIS